ncbi:MAG: peptidoglycan-binding domain-containing protein [Geminicoccaceae bacterium]
MSDSEVDRHTGINSRRILAVATTLLFSSTAMVHAADCFDGQRIGLFTERHYSELDAATRDRASDPKIDHLAKNALRETRADVVTIKAESKENALGQARGDKLAVLAYLDVEAKSQEIEMQFGQSDMVTIETATKLQFLSSDSGRLLGESSDFGKSAGLDIEQALPELLQPTLASMAKEAARTACKNNLAGEPAVAQVTTQSKPTSPPADTTLVSDIQYTLIDLGYDIGTPDGIAGQQTNKAILEAERALRLPPTGKPSETLLAKLKDRSRQMVTETQQLLKALGRVKSEPSGVLNGETVQAIETVELEQRLPFDGKPDPDLIRILRAELRGGGTAEPPSSTPENDPALRLRVERLLFKLGYLETPPTGQETFEGREAIVRAETELGLDVVDGIPDLELYRVLDARERGS